MEVKFTGAKCCKQPWIVGSTVGYPGPRAQTIGCPKGTTLSWLISDIPWFIMRFGFPFPVMSLLSFTASNRCFPFASNQFREGKSNALKSQFWLNKSDFYGRDKTWLHRQKMSSMWRTGPFMECDTDCCTVTWIINFCRAASHHPPGLGDPCANSMGVCLHKGWRMQSCVYRLGSITLFKV